MAGEVPTRPLTAAERHGLAFRDPSQEQRFRAYFSVKRYWLDVMCGVLPLTIFSLLNSSRYLDIRACSCPANAAAPCQDFVQQNPWMATFPCGHPPPAVFRWFILNFHLVQLKFWMQLEFLDIGLVMLLHYVLIALALLGRRSWCHGQRRRRFIIFMRLTQKLVNVLAVFTTSPEWKPSFMDVHFGPGTLHGATVLLWHSQLIALPLVDSAYLVPFECGALATIILARARSRLTLPFITEVLAKQLLLGALPTLLLLLSFERSQRATFLRLEARGKTGAADARITGAADVPNTGASDAGADPPATCPLSAATATPAPPPADAASDPPCPPPTIAARRQLEAAAAKDQGARRAGPRRYTPRMSLQVVSVKINNPPAGVHADPAPLAASINAALRAALPPHLHLSTRCTVIRGCLHLLLWVQAPEAAPHPPSTRPDTAPQAPAGGTHATDDGGSWKAGVAERVLDAVQDSLAGAASNGAPLGITVSAYGHSALGAGADEEPQVAGTGAGSPGCWVVGGRVTLPCVGGAEGQGEGPEERAGGLVVALVPGSWQEAALVAAGGRARAVLVQVGSGRVLLDVETVAGDAAGVAQVVGAEAGWLAAAGVQCVSVPLDDAPLLPAGSAAYLLLLPHQDRSGRVLCSFPMLAAPPTVHHELQAYFLDAVADASDPAPHPPAAKAPPAAHDGAPAPNDLPPAPDQAHPHAAAACAAFTDSLLGLVWDMLSCMVPAAPLHAPTIPAAATQAGAATQPLPGGLPLVCPPPPAADCTPEEVAGGLSEFLDTQHLPATAAYFQQHSRVPSGYISCTPPAAVDPEVTAAAGSAACPRSSSSSSRGSGSSSGSSVSGRAFKSAAAAKLCLALPAIDMAASTLQLMVVVVCYVQQQYSVRILLYYLVLLSLYVSSLGPFWHFWRCRNLTTLPLLLRMAAAAPYICGWVPLHSISSSTAHRLLLLLLLNGAMHTVYVRYGHMPGGKQATCDSQQALGDLPADGRAAAHSKLAADAPATSAASSKKDD